MFKSLFLIGVMLLSLPQISNAFGGGYMMGGTGYGSGMGIFGGLTMIIFWVVVIAGIVYFIQWILGQNQDTKPKEDNSLNILKERFAKGEINKKEFEEMKKELLK